MTVKSSQPFIAQKTERRGPIAAEYASPGPASVHLPALVGFRKHDFSKGKEPAYSFGHRHRELTQGQSPGPGTYNVVGLYSKGGRNISSAASIHGRYKETAKLQTPAPSAYSPEKFGKLSTYQQSPRYSFGGKWLVERPKDTPGANQYLVPSSIGKRSMSATGKGMQPGFSITGRNTVGSFYRGSQAPGPGAYNVVEPRVYNKSAPSYSMNSRTIVMVDPDSKNKPGPGTHDIRNSIQGKRAGGFSFGIRHSEYEAPLILAKDIN